MLFLKRKILGYFSIAFLLFFVFSNLADSSEKSSDVIAIRVFPNPNHYSSLQWYKKNVGPLGTPQSLMVDGYEAIRNGSMVYVNAANVDLGSSKMYTNIYLITYNQESNKETIDIFGEILKKWSFNINLPEIGKCSISVINCERSDTNKCEEDYSCDLNNKCIPLSVKECFIDSDCPNYSFCDSEKAKVTRDVKRLADLNALNETLSAYKEKHGNVPILSGGSYLPNISISVWPSWQNSLGKELGVELPINPINSLGNCGSNDYLPSTCWDEHEKMFANFGAQGTFVLPPNSNAYVYMTEKHGKSYSLCGIMESDYNSSYEDGDCSVAKGIGFSLTDCGDGIIQSPNTAKRGGVNNDGFEQCDRFANTTNIISESSISKQYHCSSNCVFDGGWCGDGSLQLLYGEQCDGAANVVDRQASGCNNECQCKDPYFWHSSKCMKFCPNFEFVELWHWDGSELPDLLYPSYNQVMMTPVAADLDGDSSPEIIFNSFSPTENSPRHSFGYLRAIDGRTGEHKFTIKDHPINAGFNIAVGDIDNDGLPEIVTGKYISSNRLYWGLIAFDHNGNFKWSRDDIFVGASGGVSIADINNDGQVEIVLGSTVLRGVDGSTLWTGLGAGQGSYLSTIADIDLDGSPEVVTGCTVYKNDGTALWDICNTYSDGWTAIGNFDDDPFPEIVVVRSGKVRLHEHDGSLKWQSDIPSNTVPVAGGGPPTVANYDSDPMPEIGIAAAEYYVVFESDGTLKWKKEVKDRSSKSTGSSVFDFNNDGKAEILYADEIYFRVYSGDDGEELLKVENGSGTLTEYPTVIDINNDGFAEIIVPANNYAYSPGNFGKETGIRAFGNSDPDCVWAKTGKIWNQHTYHVTNINSDGTIPQFEINNWEVPGLNSYRQNMMIE